MQVVQICDGVGDTGKNRNPRQLSVGGEICSTVQNQSGRDIVRPGVQQRHCCWRGRVPPAESSNLPGVPPFPPEWARIRESSEVCAVKPAQLRSSYKLHTFVDVKVILAKILAHENLHQVCHCHG